MIPSQLGISRFRETLTRRKGAVVIDLSGTRVIDGCFFRCFMLRKHLNGREEKLIFVGAKPAIRGMFRLSGVGFLLSSG